MLDWAINFNNAKIAEIILMAGGRTLLYSWDDLQILLFNRYGWLPCNPSPSIWMVETWTVDDVYSFATTITAADEAFKLKQHRVTGRDFLSFKNEDLLNCGLLVGPAKSLYQIIEWFRGDIQNHSIKI